MCASNEALTHGEQGILARCRIIFPRLTGKSFKNKYLELLGRPKKFSFRPGQPSGRCVSISQGKVLGAIRIAFEPYPEYSGWRSFVSSGSSLVSVKVSELPIPPTPLQLSLSHRHMLRQKNPGHVQVKMSFVFQSHLKGSLQQYICQGIRFMFASGHGTFKDVPG